MTTPVIDYEGSNYRTDFWEGQGRDYEDAVERVALRRLLPSVGGRICEVGAGFGRLADEYLGYEQIVLFDYSRTLLQEAAQRWGRDPRFVFVAGDLYNLPLADGVLDALVMVRVMHHLADVSAALAQLERAMHSQSVAVLEFANKRNIKALLRWVLGRQAWSPVDLEPVEFVELNFDFHPTWMRERLEGVGFDIKRQLAVSHFRLPMFKHNVGAGLLAKVDGLFFDIGGLYPLAPSVFISAATSSSRQPVPIDVTPEAIATLFCCPQCSSQCLAMIDVDLVECAECNVRCRREKGVWDFKDPV